MRKQTILNYVLITGGYTLNTFERNLYWESLQCLGFKVWYILDRKAENGLLNVLRENYNLERSGTCNLWQAQ